MKYNALLYIGNEAKQKFATMKITIDKALEEYTTKELVDFHANISALFMCVWDWDKPALMTLSMHCIVELEKRPEASTYLEAFKTMLKKSA